MPIGSQAVTVWDGTSWSNGLPDTNTKAVFAAEYLSTKELQTFKKAPIPLKADG